MGPAGVAGSPGGVTPIKILMFSALAALATPAIAAPYAVIFEVTRGQDGNIEKLAVSKVIDPKSGSTAAVGVKVPQAYVDKARERIQAKPAAPDKPHYFTYFFFDPRDPTNLDVAVTD